MVRQSQNVASLEDEKQRSTSRNFLRSEKGANAFKGAVRSLSSGDLVQFKLWTEESKEQAP